MSSNNKKGKSSGKKKRIPIWVLMSIGTLLGVVLILLGSLIEIKFIPTESWIPEFKNLIIAMFQNLGQALFVAGLIGLIFEMDSIKNYFEKRISDILIDDKYLKHQDYNSLLKLRQRATKNIYNRKSNDVDPELIELDKQICDALIEPYFDFYQETSHCKFSEDGTYLIKKIKSRFKLINPQKGEIDLFSFLTPRIRFKKILNVNDDEIRKLQNFDIWVDGHPPRSITDIIEIKTFSEEVYDHQEEYSVKTEFGLKENASNSIKSELIFNDYFEVLIVEERKIPLDDFNYFFRLETSAKNFKIGLVFENSKYELDGNLFGTMSNPRNGIFIDKDSNSITIESRRWMLKGNGAYINIVPKDWSLTKI